MRGSSFNLKYTGTEVSFNIDNEDDINETKVIKQKKIVNEWPGKELLQHEDMIDAKIEEHYSSEVQMEDPNLNIYSL